MPEPYEPYAIHYAHNPKARRATTSSAAIRMRPMPLDYSSGRSRAERTFVFDTGFDAPAVGEKSNRQFVARRVGLKATAWIPASAGRSSCRNCIHHCGNHDLFRTRYMCRTSRGLLHRRCIATRPARPFEETDVVAIGASCRRPRRVPRRVDELAPGLTVHHVGGPLEGPAGGCGAWTRRGWMAGVRRQPLYRQHGQGRAFPIMHSHEEHAAGYATCAVGQPSDNIIPVHDRWCCSATRGLTRTAGIVVRSGRLSALAFTRDASSQPREKHNNGRYRTPTAWASPQPQVSRAVAARRHRRR